MPCDHEPYVEGNLDMYKVRLHWEGHSPVADQTIIILAASQDDAEENVLDILKAGIEVEIL